MEKPQSKKYDADNDYAGAYGPDGRWQNAAQNEPGVCRCSASAHRKEATQTLSTLVIRTLKELTRFN